MIEKPYRIGKKVCVFTMNYETREDVLKEGRIIARRWWKTLRGDNRVGLDAKYVVEYEDGTHDVVGQDQIWTKWGHGEDLV